MKKTTVKEQKISKQIARLSSKILRAYAIMAVAGQDTTDYFAPINKLVDEIRFVIANACICEIFNSVGLYALVCAAHEHLNTNTVIRGGYVRPDKNLKNLRAALCDLSDAGWPCPGHVQFWDWVAELRRRPKYWNNGSENRSAFHLNSWEWIINWDKLDWSEGFDIIDCDESRVVVGYLMDDDHTPVYIECKNGLWIGGHFGNKSWREKEYLSTAWRNPFAASFALYREPKYPGANWYNGPGTECYDYDDEEDEEDE